ncbi:MAG TPA: allophanate hydrolase [Stellaceae bacterium]|nr:allophanate hydrolase [Stellaceae bacterium]
MLPSLDFAALNDAYRSGRLSPVWVVDEVTARIRGRGNHGVWISRFPEEVLRAEAKAVERRAAVEGLDVMPLYGLPFAVKDNIDVAGLPTTCACPEFSYEPARSAPVVEHLRRAGAICVGKTNLDQFATGLAGVRSPYGIPRNPFDPAYIPGGSSSGSAVAVAAGQVAFALGTDTAGSGRVPASFNNIVGLKPTRGLIPASGVVPACRSLDCVSIFALTVADAATVFDVARGVDAADGRSRPAPPGFGAMGRLPERFTFGMVAPSDLEFFGEADGPTIYAAAIDRLRALGGEPVTIDYGPFLEVATLVYRGPWLAERHRAIATAIGGRWDVLHPMVRDVIAAGGAISGADVYAGFDRLAALRQQTQQVWRQIDLLVLPTTGTIYRIVEIEAAPVALNENLGRYTNFCNLLDLSAIAVPAGFRGDGLPCGVTLFAPAFHDPLLAAIGNMMQVAAGLPLGATDQPCPAAQPAPTIPGAYPFVPILVLGAHLSGQPLNPELVALGARLRRTVRTAPEYGLYALPDGKRPGLVRRASGGGAIEGEVWDVPAAAVGALLARIAPPLGLGSVLLADGSVVKGFLCEASAVETARDITRFGGWRAAIEASA